MDVEEDMILAANQRSESASETEEIAKELLAFVCRKGGIINVTDTIGSLSQNANNFVSKHGFYPLLQTSLKDILTLEITQRTDPRIQPRNQTIIKVKVDVGLCKDYANSECLLDDCPRLHICLELIKGNCAFSNCNLNHNFSNNHEKIILTRLKLDSLHEDALLPLLRSVTFLGVCEGILSDVEVCTDYNSVKGCPTAFLCSKLHLCTAFSKGECRKREAECMRSHDVLSERSRLVEALKIRHQQIITTRIINYQHILSLARKAAFTREGPPTIDEICSFHLKGNCYYGRLCKRYWSNLPYLWQIEVTLDDGVEKWVTLPELYSEMIEWDYCDVYKDTSLTINFGGGQDASLRVSFNDMTAKTSTGNHSVNIRRLSTASWIKASPGDTFGTRWTWYWKNDQDMMVSYDEDCPVSSSMAANSSSNEILEEHYLAGAESFTLTLNGETYNIDLKNGQQTNKVTGRCRQIRRRPSKFFGTQHIPTILQSRRQLAEQPSSPDPASYRRSMMTLPQGWTAMSTDQDVAIVTLQPGSAEYNHTQTEFTKTLRNKTIHKIERVQNIDLWESYSRKLAKLSRKLGRPVEVRELFHGTSEAAVKAICQQGFDWRVNGVNGTACGKGSYFAVAASCSDGYSSCAPATGHKMMFLNKVIVGLYVVGNSSTVRPPAIDPNKPYDLYHSCVNDTNNPSLFVVFENDQAYPQYLITYS